MKAWLANRSSRKYHTTYMSPRSQNEFITLLGEEIREKISNKVKKSEYCSVMADTTPDVGHVDELSVAVRFVDVDTLKPEEHLVYVKETYDKTGEGQAKDIVHSLESADIPLSAVQFQNTIQHLACPESTKVRSRNLVRFSSERYHILSVSLMALI